MLEATRSSAASPASVAKGKGVRRLAVPPPKAQSPVAINNKAADQSIHVEMIGHVESPSVQQPCVGRTASAGIVALVPLQFDGYGCCC
jgi:hypothetical protein